MLDPSSLFAAATIFTGAFLLFEVESIIAKVIIPWFGGSAQVWTTCLLFFQLALLAGYLYAHLLSEYLRRNWQVRIHITLLLVSLAFLPIVPSEQWKPAGGENPLPLILGLLGTTIGLPFILLSATNPLVQGWLARSGLNVHSSLTRVEPQAPYHLFALSNFGSMLALLTYPVLVEPDLALRSQISLWSVLYGAFVLFSAATGLIIRPDRATTVAHSSLNRNGPSLSEWAIWFALAAAPSALLLALTNYMLQNIAAIPLFWTIPLALYLLSFIVAFSNLRWFWRPFWYELFAGAIVALLLSMLSSSGVTGLGILSLLSGLLFVCCLVCNGELAALRPAPRFLTGYYLTIATGGAAGGLFVAAIAPTAFNANYELPILIPATALLIILVGSRHYRSQPHSSRRYALVVAALITLSAASLYLARTIYNEISAPIVLARNFYGALRVLDQSVLGERRRMLLNGSIDHGEEFTAPDKRREPLTYYSRISGIGILLDELGHKGPLHVGVIGLGAGTIAAYGRTGDTYRFYEINPSVLRIARNNFWYLSLNPAQTTIILGDARLSLERETSQQFDVLAVDAFTSDAIPVHLLTREAFALYWRHLKQNGVLAVHVSNRYADLAQIVAMAAVERGQTARLLTNDADPREGVRSSKWVLVTSRPDLFESGALQRAKIIPLRRGLRAWTDNYSNLWRILWFNTGE